MEHANKKLIGYMRMQDVGEGTTHIRFNEELKEGQPKRYFHKWICPEEECWANWAAMRNILEARGWKVYGA